MKIKVKKGDLWVRGAEPAWLVPWAAVVRLRDRSCFIWLVFRVAV